MSDFVPSFSGHETFPFRYGWLKKGFDAFQERPDIFTAEDATSVLGVGKNMVRSIKHWCLSCGLLEEKSVTGHRLKHISASKLGSALVGDGGFDPYLEDFATLWLIHYNLASQPGRCHSWFWIFNHFLKREFTKADLRQEMLSVCANYPAARASSSTIKRDIDCFVRTYVASSRASTVLEDSLDCPLVELGLINELADGETLTFDPGERNSLPNSLFAYVTLYFWEQNLATSNTCTFERLAYSPGSPGRAFRMSDKELISRLEKMERLTNGAVSYDETAGLKQLYRKSALASFDFLPEVYRELPEVSLR